MKITYARRPALVFLEAALLSEATTLAATLSEKQTALLVASHSPIFLRGDRGGNRYKAFARRGITYDNMNWVLTDLGVVLRKVVRARAMLAGMSHELRDGLLLRYAMSICPSWFPSFAVSEFAPYIDNDGLLNSIGKKAGAATVLLDPLCTRYAHERALKELST